MWAPWVKECTCKPVLVLRYSPSSVEELKEAFKKLDVQEVSLKISEAIEKLYEERCARMSDDSISRRAAIDTLKKISFSQRFECGEYLSEDIMEIKIINSNKALEAIEALPAVEPERKTGKWIRLRKCCHKCSACGNFLDFRGVNAGRGDANFCPNCGAEMRGEEE